MCHCISQLTLNLHIAVAEATAIYRPRFLAEEIREQFDAHVVIYHLILYFHEFLWLPPESLLIKFFRITVFLNEKQIKLTQNNEFQGTYTLVLPDLYLLLLS